LSRLAGRRRRNTGLSNRNLAFSRVKFTKAISEFLIGGRDQRFIIAGGAKSKLRKATEQNHDTADDRSDSQNGD
jgi:hypothetical protein